MDHIFAFSHVQTRYLALGPRFGLVLVAQVKGFASRRSFWADFRDFVILGGAGDMNNSISTANYCNGPYCRLLPCANKVFSAWTEVWSYTCRSSKRFCFPEVVLGRFSRFLPWSALVIGGVECRKIYISQDGDHDHVWPNKFYLKMFVRQYIPWRNTLACSLPVIYSKLMLRLPVQVQ